MRISITDRLTFPVSTQREITPEGYLKVPGRVARAGVQQYTALELELKDRPATEIINVYRPPQAVFAPDSLATYDNADITVDHPSELVNAKTFKRDSVGHAISPGRQDESNPDYVVVDLLIKAQDAIDAINLGKAELSAGYTSEYLLTPDFVAPDGTPCEFTQSDIIINHIALCDSARAGHKARIFDSKRGKAMPRVIIDSGAQVEVADEATRTLLQTTIDNLKKRVKDAEEEAEKSEEEKVKAEARADAKDEENEELKEKASEDSISKRVAEVMAARDSALKIAGREFACDSANPVVIKRAALDAAGIKCKKYDSWAKAPDAYVSAYFDAEEERKEAEDEEEEEERKEAGDSLKKFGKELGKLKSGDAKATRDSVRNAFLDKRYGRTQEGK
ncbi:DUF2213 domain-containing protein [Pluralibacter gergoviae]|uniref:DUF2213 domain-containing protein n=1 Tax=Pluralibacter gergoviae TaxID=61647 RepID=A0AAI9DLR2_PLUGE|nr:DUF2213 domain-containing protein [Pluralibacter gergoviae]EKV9907723.1 DUF2213 domain-containing protein [Pluralibacter gergoviae]EKW7276808.1 DUF2213 domain-containing protein [Pluralibacter gergoviae]ELD4293945.1 DUF2213 domain-containing protein [Pluralibacter gergoviae]ELD4304724.1 DUF2213 domain-containing protein [Pluralibacter gergoviae]